MVYSKHPKSSVTLKDKVLKMIEDDIVEVEDEIEAHNKGVETVGTLRQLTNILNQLSNMEVALSPKQYMTSYWRIIVDS